MLVTPHQRTTPATVPALCYDAGMDNNTPHQRGGQPCGSCQHGNADYEPTPDAQITGAYYRYVDQGSVPGHALRHWLDAERSLADDRQLDRRVAFGCQNP
jgi:hypothetical protein